MAGKPPEERKLDAIVAKARAEAEARDRGYREQALKLYPWVCGRCGRAFERANLHELTVHHRNHNHDDNPPDGSNWELLCLYCHDNEHQRQLLGDQSLGVGAAERPATFSPFSDLSARIKRQRE